MILAIIGSELIEMKEATEIIKRIIEEKIKPEDTVITSDRGGVAAIVRSLPMKVANRRICLLDKSIPLEEALKEQRRVMLQTADRIFVIWEGRDEFTKMTLTILKSMTKLYEEYKIETDRFMKIYQLIASLTTEMIGWKRKLIDIQNQVRKLEEEVKK